MRRNKEGTQTTEYTDISITLPRLLLKATGTWMGASSAQQQKRKYAMAYTIFSLIYGVGVNVMDIYHNLDDLSHCIYLVCNTLNISLAIFKLTILNFHRTELVDLLLYAKRHFWHLNYDKDDIILFTKCRQMCKFFVLCLCGSAQVSLVFYIARPIYLNIGRNKSDRVLPFAMWVNLPLDESPYFEMMFLIQILAVQQIGVSIVCPENVLCVLNLHVVSQFRMLQHKLRNLWLSDNERKDAIDYSDKCHTALKKCIQQHQSLVKFCDKLEYVYTLPILSHVVIFSVLMCFGTYEILLGDVPTSTRLIFIFQMCGSSVHILFFTYSCDGIMEESSNVSMAVYSSLWTNFAMSETEKMIRSDVKMIMMKTMRPCCLTAGGFFPVSLKTSTTLMSSTMSYFALMRESSTSLEGSE